MKLLFDENISFRVVNRIISLFPDSTQVRELQLESMSDTRIWKFAQKENYTIVTFDSDFDDLLTLYGHPPKIIWLRIGNISTQELVKVFQKHFNLIKCFLTDESYRDIGCLEIID